MSKLTPGEMMMLRRIASVDPAEAGEEWRALSEAQTTIAADRTGGQALTVVTAPGASGDVPGLHAPKAAKILLDGSRLPVTPDKLDPQNNPEHLAALSSLHGVLIHECGHASHTLEERDALRHEDDETVQAVVLLEEIRMEAQVIRNRPSDARWLRAATEDLILAGKTGEEIKAGGEMAAFSATVLLEGRVDAGTLQHGDLGDIPDFVKDTLGEDTYKAARSICAKAVSVADDDLDGLIDLGRELSALFPEQEGGGGGGPLIKKIKEALEDASGSGDMTPEEMEEIEDMLSDAKAREEISKAIEEMEKQSAGAATGASPERNEREATPEERRARVDLTRVLREVRWRDRHVVKRTSVLPPGRLRSRAALRRSAEIAEGKMPRAEPWKVRRRRAVDMPRLTCGVLLDTSGSMYGVERELSGALWALSHAVYDNGGRVASSLFGDTSELLWGVENPPRYVTQIRASGGTDHVDQSIQILDKALAWHKEDGPRLLVLVSDGYFGGAENDAAIQEAQSRGIKVIHIGIGMDPLSHGADETLRIDSASDLARVVGETAVRELRSWG